MKKRGSGGIFQALGLLTQLGLTMAACVFIGIFAGRFLDNRLGTTPWLLLLFTILGVLAAFKIMFDIGTGKK